MAGGSLNNNDDEIITSINVTPLVDVMLVLLVMFMITAPIIYQAGIKIELPKTKSGEKTESITLKFTLSKDGKITQGQDVLTKEKVIEVVKNALKKDPQTAAVISADKALDHGTVIEFMDLLKSSGVMKLAIGVDASKH